MYSDYLDYISDETAKKEHIINAMYSRKDEALMKLSHAVRREFLEDFSKAFLHSWFDEEPTALKIAENLELSRIDFMAIDENFECFKDLYEQECEYYQYA